MPKTFVATPDYTAFDGGAIEAAFNEAGISSDSFLVKEVLRLAKEGETEAHNAAYGSGYDRGFGACAEDPPDHMLDDLKIGLDLIDTDRATAKVYLDRATKHYGKHLIEVSPCLL